ncbi:calpain-7 [Gaeumannomyces tritici R3-111a-1]|uniref:Calpain-7 n=1 Tax=Gaeumannomyces tritici (strain R3-111a-1) TaxID=644352 RepID=J3P7N4_GAET3|nr:calpain-7 [Gaeumannomyces tritici R3-111a-1]EJT72666.1 calpain-7 [Gaeumannomyces tritici R3-111a-1]
MEAKALELERLARRASGKDAVKHAIAAAEAYMKAAKDASSPAEKNRLKHRCEEVIVFAERLKGPRQAPGLATDARKGSRTAAAPGGSGFATACSALPQGPAQSRQLPTSEKTILLRSSRLHGNIFPPWDTSPSDDGFRLSPADGNTLYSDPSHFTLSQRQQDIFAGWKRPSDMFSPPGGASRGIIGRLPSTLMHPATESDLVQDITTDCSVVASLCASMKHLNSPKNPLLANLMYPFDAANASPIMSENGKYVFRMYFNGCFRQVTIDDRLPASRTSRTLFVVDRKNPQLIWPALMEKAYLKVRGGYDFPGSNSGTDLWVLTGWIPEQIFLHADDMEPEQSWTRISKAFQFGDVVVTLGTGRLSFEEEDAIGLAGEHDYAVLDMRVENGVRRMLVKNPWCDGLVWKGVGSSAILEPKTTPSSPRDGVSPPDSGELPTGTFWISFEDVVQNFESLYLNWNPTLFTHRQDHHFTWDVPDSKMANSFAKNPQYSICASSAGSVWVVLSRHFQDDELAIARNRSASSCPPMANGTAASFAEASAYPTATDAAGLPNTLGFTSLYLFHGTDGTRIQLPDRPRPQHRRPFVDSPQMLLRFEATKGERYTLAVAQSGLPLPKYTFSLSLFSRCPLDVAKAEPEHVHYETVQGSWTRRSAGGNASESTYLSNPQYSIHVKHPTAISLLLCADNPDLPVHVDLMWAGSGRGAGKIGIAAEITGTARDIVASSGEYRRGSALCVVSPSSPASTATGGAPVLQEGFYIAVLSTFEPGQLAAYTLEVGSSTREPVVVTPAARTGAAAGRLRTALAPLPPPPAVRRTNSDEDHHHSHHSHHSGSGPGGSDHSDSSPHKEGEAARVHRAPLLVSRLTRVSARVAPRSGSLDAVRIRIQVGVGARGRPLAIGGGSGGSGVDPLLSMQALVEALADCEFAEASRGARTAEVDVDPDLAHRGGGLWVVVEQIGSTTGNGGAEGPLLSSVSGGGGMSPRLGAAVEILSDNPVQVGGWEQVKE